MSASVTLTELRARVRKLADMRTSAQASHFEDDTELDRAINRGLKRLYDRLIITRGADYYDTSAEFTTVSGKSYYGVADGFPADFYQLLTVLANDSTNTSYWPDLPRFEYKDLGALRQYTTQGSSGIYLMHYRLIGNGIELQPEPQAAYTIELHYIPAFDPLVNPSDTFDGVNGWEDWACYSAAIDILNEEESYEQAQAHAAALGRIDQQIEQLAGNRDAGRAPQVAATRVRRSARRRRRRNDWYV